MGHTQPEAGMVVSGGPARPLMGLEVSGGVWRPCATSEDLQARLGVPGGGRGRADQRGRKVNWEPGGKDGPRGPGKRGKGGVSEAHKAQPARACGQAESKLEEHKEQPKYRINEIRDAAHLPHFTTQVAGKLRSKAVPSLKVDRINAF